MYTGTALTMVGRDFNWDWFFFKILVFCFFDVFWCFFLVVCVVLKGKGIRDLVYKSHQKRRMQ